MRSQPLPTDPLSQLFSDEYVPMVRLATLITGSQDLAEELVMDSIARVAPRIESIDRPGGYLRTAVINAARSHHRSVIRAAQHRHAPVESASHDPEIDELWGQLARLRPDERACVVLRYYEDLSLAEVAEQLDLPLGTVKSHLHRALAILRTELSNENGEDR